ncbi:unnamed protein product, partial [Notodromas monacha]
MSQSNATLDWDSVLIDGSFCITERLDIAGVAVYLCYLILSGIMTLPNSMGAIVDHLADEDDADACDERHVNYAKGAQYWTQCDPTVDAMLGGFSKLSQLDISASQQFMATLYKLEDPPGKDRAVDCGAGIGRITELFLQHRFKKVDLVEQCEKFLNKAKEKLQKSATVGDFICCGLQDFNPSPDTYDIVWTQWVLSHLTDKDLVNYLRRCTSSLKPNGVLVLKENVTRDDEQEVDETDGS